MLSTRQLPPFLWDIERQGYQAGYHGGSYDDCPYSFVTSLIDRWRNGFDAGARQRAEDLAGMNHEVCVGR